MINIIIYILIGIACLVVLLKLLNTSSNGQKKYLDPTNWRDKDLIKYYERYKDKSDKKSLAPDGQGEVFFESMVEEIKKRELETK